MKRLFEEQLGLLPDTKLVIGNIQWANVLADEIGETLEVYFLRDTALATVLELLNKRWQTLDLISVMQEVKRTLASSHAHSHSRFMVLEEVVVRENLSRVPRLQKVDKSLGKLDSTQIWGILLAYNPFSTPGLSPTPLPIPYTCVLSEDSSPTGMRIYVEVLFERDTFFSLQAMKGYGFN